jgi:hypothetical protein
LVSADENGITEFPGAIILGAADTATRDFFGDDSTLITGGLFYNTTEDRVQFFQAGSWVNLINNGSTIGQLLAWNGTEWAAVDPEITAGTIANANTLNGFNGSYYLDYDNLTNTPTTLAGYGIVDAVLSSELGSFTFTGSVLDTDDSSAISVTPATVFNSDVTVENDLVVTNKITAKTIEVDNIITSSNGTPELSSDGAILISAGTRVEITQSPLKMASFTTTERNALTPQNGDVIYNTTDSKFQGYTNGVWNFLDGSSSITWSISASGTSDYVFSGPGIVAGNTNDPVLYLYKGFTYTFVNTTGGSHPFAIRVSNGGADYTPGVSGSQTGTQTFVVPMNAPATLYYQCTIHSGMGNVINIV